MEKTPSYKGVVNGGLALDGLHPRRRHYFLHIAELIRRRAHNNWNGGDEVVRRLAHIVAQP